MTQLRFPVAFLSLGLLAACSFTVSKSETSSSVSSAAVSEAMEADVVTDESGSEENKGELMPEDESGSEEDKDTEDAGGDGSEMPKAEAATQTRVVAVTTDNWAFSPTTVTAKKGEKVQVVVTGVTGTHGFSSPGLGINASVSAGQTVTVDLPTDKAGSFDFFCSIPCGSGHKDMKGTIVIAE